jgi:ubiquitin-like 1-activating enzyme E1 B
MPNPECPVCSTYYTSVQADLSRATLKDLVEDFTRLQLGFEESAEFSITSDAGAVFYDPDFTDNLEKKLSELGTQLLLAR